jgi:hypothetical protein
MSSPHIPDPEPELEAEGIPDLEGPLESKQITGDGQEGIWPPGDEPKGAEEYGVTAAEQAVDEPLAERVRREEPEILPSADPDEVGSVRRGARILDEADLDVDTIDDVKETVAEDVGVSGGGLTAEEAAMRIEEG